MPMTERLCQPITKMFYNKRIVRNVLTLYYTEKSYTYMIDNEV